MGNQHDDDPDDAPDNRLREGLAGLRRELSPPDGLEARVVTALGERGWLAAARPRRTAWRGGAGAGGAVAACLALLLAGYWLGRQGIGRGGQPPAMARYLLLLREGGDFNLERWPEARLVAENARWAQRLRAARHLVAGEELESGGWVLTSARAEARPATAREEAPAGFFIVDAANDQEALSIARSCPALRHGGRIELRRVHPS